MRGEVNGISIFDDYAHHPTEIKATLAGARARYPERRIWAVWQPHTYSRTQTLFLEFSRAFKDADEVIVTEVYAAREPKQDFTSAEIVSAMPHFSARYIETLPEVTNHLIENLRRGDVVLVLSAGDADQISADVVKGLQERQQTMLDEKQRTLHAHPSPSIKLRASLLPLRMALTAAERGITRAARKEWIPTNGLPAVDRTACKPATKRHIHL